MSVISILLQNSPLEKVSGIPLNLTISTNIPTTIFYTLDGTSASIDSELYIGPITLPTDKANVVINIYATNGVDSTNISQKYQNTTFYKNRNAHDTIIGLQPGKALDDLFPFGSNSPSQNLQYGNTGGITVNSFDDQTNLKDGYDGTATNTASDFTDKPLTDYKFKYSDKTVDGKDIGIIPKVKIFVPPAPPETSNTKNKLFNPKSLVIIQDGRDETDIPILNRPFFSSEDINKVRDGSMYYTTGGEASPTGSFVRQYYNPRDQTITYYYFDSQALRWIISIEPYNPKPSQLINLNCILLPPSRSGAQFVYKWIPFLNRILG